MIGICWPCAAGTEHVWHDNGDPHMPVQCEDLDGGYEGAKVLRRREEICAAGHCVCQERRPPT